MGPSVSNQQGGAAKLGMAPVNGTYLEPTKKLQVVVVP